MASSTTPGRPSRRRRQATIAIVGANGITFDAPVIRHMKQSSSPWSPTREPRRSTPPASVGAALTVALRVRRGAASRRGTNERIGRRSHGRRPPMTRETEWAVFEKACEITASAVRGTINGYDGQRASFVARGLSGGPHGIEAGRRRDDGQERQGGVLASARDGSDLGSSGVRSRIETMPTTAPRP